MKVKHFCRVVWVLPPICARLHAKIAAPLINLLKDKRKNFQWGEPYSQSFEKLKVAITLASMLRIVDLNQPFVVLTEVSGEASIVVFLQVIHLVSFESRKLNPA